MNKSLHKRESRRPAYKGLSSDLRSALEQGLFDESNALPTEAELSRVYGVSRNTVRQAFQSLVAEGLVYRVPGRGTFPTSLSKRGHYLRSIGDLEDLMSWTGTEMEVIRPLEIKRDAEVAARLELTSDEIATLVQRRWYEKVPIGLISVYLPPELGQILIETEALPTWSKGTVIGTLEQLMTNPVAGADQSISAVPAPEHVAELIGCEAKEAILRVERIYFGSDNRPVELAICHYNPRNYTYNIKLRRRTT